MIPFEKWHGAGNEFILIDASEYTIRDPPEFAIRECDRERGIGADGVLVLVPREAENPPRVEMTLVQPDGSTAAMCGNGARCAAKWLAARTGATEVIVDTPAGPRHAQASGDTVTVDMGAYSFAPDEVPLDRDEPLIEEPIGGLVVTAVTTGVPHAVGFVDDIDAVDLDAVAPGIRHADVFPQGTNVTLAQATDSGFRQRTFERGVEGETVACGTGAIAIAAVGAHLGRVSVDAEIPVFPPGGRLSATIHPDATATLRGPVTREFTGEVASA